MRASLSIWLVAAGFGLAAAGSPAGAESGRMLDLTTRVPRNAFAAIPPQCYTRTRDTEGGVHNPCYTCHVTTPVPNYVRDGDLQTLYDFPGPARVNAWTNLFRDRRAEIAATTDDEIRGYIGEDNYHDVEGQPALAAVLADLPAGWDINGDGIWSGYLPDVHFRFDGEGYDLDPSGARTGWRAYGYVPLPGAFWPTNGSADDVLIRLPEAFRQTSDGATDWEVYATNLAIVEALVRRADVPIAPTDETRLGVDLDRDGQLATATHVAFAFDPRNGVTMGYVGRAAAALAEGHLHLAAGLFPEGTEFVHSLRYLDVAYDGTVGPAPRMKELRYARKTGWKTYGALLDLAMSDRREEHDYPDRPEHVLGDVESGVSTGQGWRFQGFIEDAEGALRPQTYEESLTCAGCHGGVGRTVDNIYSFSRKVDVPAGGWYHWDRIRPLGDLADPLLPDGVGEYATYLMRNGAGDEFRANGEILDRFFPDGTLDSAAAAALRDGVGPLVDPSPERALALDKAYRLIVVEQSFDRGRVPVLAPLDATVWRVVPEGSGTGIETPVR